MLREACPGVGVTARVLVDASNVIGAVADGWWRDRPAAARRLVGRLQPWAASMPDVVVEIVLDDPVEGLPDGDHDGVTVLTARRRGRDAADERIIERLDELVADGAAANATVVTSDGALRDAAIARGAIVHGAGTFLERLDALGR
ncbi:MAG: NYN domain-containing protein [Ilumatobacteraceae bacterium]